MNYYIVENSQEAISAISTLSEASKVKTNFFVLDLITPIKRKPLKIRDCTPILELVEYEPKFISLIKYLLNDVYLSNDDDLQIDTNATIISR